MRAARRSSQPSSRQRALRSKRAPWTRTPSAPCAELPRMRSSSTSGASPPRGATSVSCCVRRPAPAPSRWSSLAARRRRWRESASCSPMLSTPRGTGWRQRWSGPSPSHPRTRSSPPRTSPATRALPYPRSSGSRADPRWPWLTRPTTSRQLSASCRKRSQSPTPHAPAPTSPCGSCARWPAWRQGSPTWRRRPATAACGSFGPRRPRGRPPT